MTEVIAETKPDLVFHLAAETGTGQSFDEPGRYCDVNVSGTAKLVEDLRRVEKKTRIVLAGSRAIYGEGAYRQVDGTIASGRERNIEAMRAKDFEVYDVDGNALSPLPTPENLCPVPASVYASSKLMQEYILTQCAADGDLDVGILRFQNVYGPGQSLKNPYTGVLSIFCAQILAGKNLEIYEDGEIVRDFVFVDDVVRSLAMMGFSETMPDVAINIGTGYPATIRECANILLQALGTDQQTLSVTGNFRPGDIRYAVADISRAQANLGWEPQVGVAQGLSQLAAWAKSEHNA
jgi:dTDP-L-rhamnose 4-epimerase